MRLVYADCVEEAGETWYAGFIREQVTHGFEVTSDDYAGTWETALRWHALASYPCEYCSLNGCVVCDSRRDLLKGRKVSIRRGLVNAISCTFNEFAVRSSRLKPTDAAPYMRVAMSLWPLERVYVTDMWTHLRYGESDTPFGVYCALAPSQRLYGGWMPKDVYELVKAPLERDNTKFFADKHAAELAIAEANAQLMRKLCR